LLGCAVVRNIVLAHGTGAQRAPDRDRDLDDGIDDIGWPGTILVPRADRAELPRI
jgi:hypothetical protein